MSFMNPREFDADPSRDLHPELESFRKELEIRLERERSRLKEEQNQALRRIEELSENSLAMAREEWSGHESVLASARDSFIADLRTALGSLFSSGTLKEDLDRLSGEAIKKIIPDGPDPGHRSLSR